ncbi:MAG TPA: hypothetical protein VK947_10620 [Planococcus sp. (in: firmicutes)]|nr:hypothetical protein [Planococcus sp. (in: firmicutes)]
MKKLALVLLAVFILAACGQPNNLVGKIGGSQQSFEDVYGTNQQDGETGLSAIYGYRSESGISTIFIEDHALFIAAPLDGLSLEEALEFANQFLPEDAELVEGAGHTTGNLNRLYIYDSETLGNTLESVGSEGPGKQRLSVRLEATEDNNYKVVQVQAQNLEMNPD